MLTKWEPLPEEYSDFRVFLRDAWHVLGLPDPTPAQYRAAYFIQNCPNKRRAIEAFRGMGKSWIASVWSCFCLRHNPQYKILVVSAAKERADNFTTFTRQLINQWDLLHCLIPGVGQRDSKLSFDVEPATPAHAPSMKSVGIFGQMAGSRADEIISDDVEVPNNSETQPKRDKLLARIGEYEDILKPGGSILFLGTPQTEDSIYNHLEQKGYTKFVIPARYPKLKEVANIYGNSLDPFLYNQLTDNPSIEGLPTDIRFSEQDLLERELSKGKSAFNLQFMLNTSLSDANRYPLKLADLILTTVDTDVAAEKYVHSNSYNERLKDILSVGLKGDYFYEPMKTVGDFIPYTGTVMFIDPSGRGQDETGYAVVKMLNGQLFVPPEGVGGLQGGYEPGVLEKLCNIAKKNKVNTVVIESNFGDGIFNALIKPYFKRIHPVAIEEVRTNQQKEARIIEALEPVLNQHRLIIDKSLVEFDKNTTSQYPLDKRVYYQLFYQLSRITKDRNSLRHDDRLDALAGAVEWWVDTLAQDADSNIEDRKDRIQRVHLDAFNSSCTSVINSLIGMDEDMIEMSMVSSNHSRSRGRTSLNSR